MTTPRPIPLGSFSAEPCVSVLVSNHNYRRYVGEAVESVLEQDYPAIELIVVDDGSTDGSPELLRDLARRDSRMKLIEQPNAGQAVAINTAFSVSRGEVISLLDADDSFDAGKARAVVNSFREQPEAGLSIHPLRPVDSRGTALGPAVPRVLDRGRLASRALASGGKTSLPPTSGLSFRRAVAEAVLPAPPELRICTDGYLREAAQLITPVVAIDEVLGCYRLHGANRRGGGRLEVERLRAMIDVEYPLICESVNRFLDDYAGGDEGARLRLEDAPGYWEKLLLIGILDAGAPENAGREPAEILARLPATARRRLLDLLVRLPGRLARPAARFLFGDVALRRKLVTVMRLARGA